MAFTTDDLLNSIKKRGIIPSDDNTINDTDMMMFADEELISYIAPLIRSFNKTYFQNHIDYPIVAGKDCYEIPARAMTGGLREIAFVDTETGQHTPITFIEVSDLAYFNNTSNQFYIKGNDIILTPVPQMANGVLRMYFYMRPNRMVLSSKGGRVTSINRTTGEVELNSMPVGYTVNSKYDFIKGTPGFETLDWDITPTALSGTELTFTSLPDKLEVGDYVNIAGESCVPQIPAEIHPMLAQAAIVRILDSLTHTEGLKNAIGKLEKMEKLMPNLIGVRVSSKPQTVRVRNNPLDFSRR